MQLHREDAAVGVAHYKPHRPCLHCGVHSFNGIFPVHQEAVEKMLKVKDDL